MYRQINNYRPILDVILNRLVDCADAKLIWYGKERCLSTIATALFYHNKPLNYVIDDNPALWGVSCGHFLTIFPVDQIVNKYGKSAIFFISSEDAETKISRLKSYGIEDNSIVLLPTEKESIKLVTDELLAPLQGKGYVELTHREMQLAMVENLKAFDSFCKPRGLRYFLASGTLLGAFRHKGFIPWDDDLDVFMPDGDYERFIQLYLDEQKRNPSRYELISYHNQPSFYANVTNFIDTEILALMPHAVFVSLQGLPISMLRVVGYSLEKREFDIQYNTNQNLDFRESEYQKLAGLIDNSPDYRTDYNELKARRSFDDAEVTGNPYIPKFWNTNRENFEPASQLEFEGGMFSVPNKYELFLKARYGDYSSIPAESDRKPSHGTIAWRKLKE
ncbi:MAG: LicD family protein [Defluviitaleaceae bacterium]|nr:LicD family protein [Defluviitaleaceae bacterium]